MNNNTPTADTTAQTTDILRAEVAQLEKIRQQISADMETLREQETNLRVYETRLRDSHPPIAAPAPVSHNHADQFALDAERDKLSRLRALTEAERRALTDERLAVREEKFALERRAEELKQREAWLETREKQSANHHNAPKAKAVDHAPFFSTKIFSFGSKRTPVA